MVDLTAVPKRKKSAPRKAAAPRATKTIGLAGVLSKLEKHEAECVLRYQRIDEKLDDTSSRLKALDIKIWGLAVLIIVAPLVHKFLA